jgi:hypothetical protein
MWSQVRGFLLNCFSKSRNWVIVFL